MFRQQLKFFLLAAVFALFSPAFVRADVVPQYHTLGGLHVALWDSRPSEKKPLIFLSHGIGGCNTHADFLGSALSAAGYIVVAPNHRDAICKNTFDPQVTPQQPFETPEQWSEQTYRDRAGDFQKLLEAMRAYKKLADSIDFDQIGLMGHSLGGYTALGVAGGWPGWELPGLKAVVAAAPYIRPYMVHNTLQEIRVPVMFQVGTEDGKRAEGATMALQRMRVPAYLVNFDGAGHLAWTDGQNQHHPLIAHYARVFFDAMLKGQSPDALGQPLRGVAMLDNNLALLQAGGPPAAEGVPSDVEEGAISSVQEGTQAPAESY